MGIDWSAIKSEYITNTDTSYRKLAQTYGVDQATIARRAKKEDWVSKRQQNVSTVQAKIVDAISDQQVDRATKLLGVADRLMEKVEEYMERMEFTGFRDTQSMKHLSGVLKDLKEIQMIRSDADLREQEARIASLNRQADKDSASRDVVVEMSEEVDALSG